MSVAGAVLLIYDHVLTLNIEVGLIWSARWSVAKVLYFMVAYLGFSASIFIFGTMLVAHFLQVVRALCKLVVLIFRTWVIFGRRKMLGIGLIVSWAVIAVVVLSILIYNIEQIKYIPDPTPGSQGCLLIEGAGRIVLVNFVLFTGIDSGMTMYHGRKHFRTSSSNIVVTLY
ncbi:hypothetical protein JB92DRAFT_2987346, partial [Gautieria morchelliformis]